MALKIGINGLGRIGRMVIRAIIESKNKILNETKFTITIEAGSISCWQKYIVNKGLNFGIDDFGKSAPYKKIYNYFSLTVENITKKTKEMINK